MFRHVWFMAGKCTDIVQIMAALVRSMSGYVRKCLRHIENMSGHVQTFLEFIMCLGHIPRCLDVSRICCEHCKKFFNVFRPRTGEYDI